MAQQVHDSLLRIKEVQARTGLSRSTLYLLISKHQFPSPIPLTPTGRSVAWAESAVNKWISGRIAAASATA